MAEKASWWRRGWRRFDWKRSLGTDALVVFALWGVTVVQPLLGLFGQNPEFFVAADADRGQILGFGAWITFAVPVALVIVQVIARFVDPRVGDVVHGAVVALLGGVLGLTIARQLDIDGTVAAGLVATAVAAVLTFVRFRFSGVQSALRILSVAPLAFLGLFVWGSDTSPLIWEGEAEVLEAVEVDERDRPPIVFLIMDELPISSLMKPDGTVDETRFPNFARLADASDWYRTATANSPNTPTSVPAILAGQIGTPQRLPVSSDYPVNLFTVLGGSYDIEAIESVTDLCPSSVCEKTEVTELDTSAGLSQTLADARVVFGHTVLPLSFRNELPVVDQTWGGFLDDDAVTDEYTEGYDGAGVDTALTSDTGAGTDRGTRQDFDEFLRDRISGNPGLTDRGSILRNAVAAYEPVDGSLLFVHDAFIPHRPWLTTPGANSYNHEVARRPGEDRWPTDEDLLVWEFQRHQMQVGYADLQLGALIDRLEEAGQWDDAMVIVTSDHGIGFQPDSLPRRPTDENVHSVYNVPLFIKRPGQTSGEIVDTNARAMDILPTIVDLLDVRSSEPLSFEGQSLVSGAPPEGKPVQYGSGPQSVPEGVDGVLAVVERNEAWVPSGVGWPGLARGVDGGELVGQPVSAATRADPLPIDWMIDQENKLTAFDPDRPLPLLITGTADTGLLPFPPPEVLIAVGDTFVGSGRFRLQDDEWRLAGLVVEELLTESGRVRLFAPDGEGNVVPLRRN